MKRILKRVLRKAGWDFHRYRPESSSDAQLVAMLKTHGVNLVADVGACMGQYGTLLRDAGYDGQIISFEPLPAPYARLVEVSSRDDTWTIAPRVALGRVSGQIEMNVAKNLASSSILPMQSLHAAAAPNSGYIGRETVKMARLDELLRPMLGTDAIVHLKIDAQGYEHEVLAGATGVIGRICGLELEMSLVRLYEGQRLYLEMLETVIAMGFSLWAIYPEFVDPRSGRHLQVEAVFFRNA